MFFYKAASIEIFAQLIRTAGLPRNTLRMGSLEDSLDEPQVDAKITKNCDVVPTNYLTNQVRSLCSTVTYSSYAQHSSRFVLVGIPFYDTRFSA